MYRYANRTKVPSNQSKNEIEKLVIPLRTYGSRGLATWRWKALTHELGEDHPAARAALGRFLAHPAFDGGAHRMIPQRGATSPEAVAWHRESKAAPGYRNRHDRERDRRNRPPWL